MKKLLICLLLTSCAQNKTQKNKDVSEGCQRTASIQLAKKDVEAFQLPRDHTDMRGPACANEEQMIYTQEYMAHYQIFLSQICHNEALIAQEIYQFRDSGKPLSSAISFLEQCPQSVRQSAIGFFRRGYLSSQE